MRAHGRFLDDYRHAPIKIVKHLSRQLGLPPVLFLEDALLVSACDKLHNARAICTDLRSFGRAVYDRFTGGRDGTLWYYSTLSDEFTSLMPGPLAVELEHAVREMERLTVPSTGQGTRAGE